MPKQFDIPKDKELFQGGDLLCTADSFRQSRFNFWQSIKALACEICKSDNTGTRSLNLVIT